MGKEPPKTFLIPHHKANFDIVSKVTDRWRQKILLSPFVLHEPSNANRFKTV